MRDKKFLIEIDERAFKVIVDEVREATMSEGDLLLDDAAVLRVWLSHRDIEPDLDLVEITQVLEET